MKTKEITLCGKQVTLAYSFATEIAFNDMTDRLLPDFIREAIACLQSQTEKAGSNNEPEKEEKTEQPDLTTVMQAIVSASIAYTEATKTEGTETEEGITIKDLMHHAGPDELWKALGTVIGLYFEFYHLSKADREQQEKDAAKAKGKGGRSKNRQPPATT